jgi:ribosomal 50S subunit-recycling heat shock protein
VRIDKFINAVNLTKRRAIAQDMIAHDAVRLNGLAVKASKQVKVGDIIEFVYLESGEKYEVLQIPTGKSIPKSQKDLYVRQMQ